MEFFRSGFYIMTRAAHQSDYSGWLRYATRYGVAISILLAFIKLLTWHFTHAISALVLLADSALDCGAAAISFCVLHYSTKPADSRYPYGRGKLEALLAFAQSICTVILALSLAYNALLGERQAQIQSPIWGLLLSSCSLVLTLSLLGVQSLVMKRTDSIAIRADYMHTRLEVWINLIVLLGFFCISIGFFIADSICALIAAVYTLWMAMKMNIESVNMLIDRALPIEEHDHIVKLVQQIPGILGVHDIRCRRSGAIRFIQLHIELRDELPLVEAHQLAVEAEQAILKQFPYADVLVHQDPQSVLIEGR